MREPASERIRNVILSILSERGVSAVGEDERLFSTGRLDSLAATEVLVLLEADYGVDLADENFDILQIDTLRDLEKLVSSRSTTGVGSPDR